MVILMAADSSEEDGTNLIAFTITTAVAFIFCVLATVFFFRKRGESSVVVLSYPAENTLTHEYLITITTSTRFNAGLTSEATVKLQVLGQWANSKAFSLRHKDYKRKILRAGRTDIFVIHSTVDLGEIQYVLIAVYNTTQWQKVKWRPNYVLVTKPATMERWGAVNSSKMRVEMMDYRLLKVYRNQRERISIWKMLAMYHPISTIYYQSDRSGAYTHFTSAVSTFSYQAAVLASSMLSFRIAGKFFSDGSEMLYGCLFGELATSVFILLEMVLRNARPYTIFTKHKGWKGLCPSKIKPARFRWDVNFDWNMYETLPPASVDQQQHNEYLLSSEGSSMAGYSSGYSTADEITSVPATTRYRLTVDKRLEKEHLDTVSFHSSVSALAARLKEQRRRERKRKIMWVFSEQEKDSKLPDASLAFPTLTEKTGILKEKKAAGKAECADSSGGSEGEGSKKKEKKEKGATGEAEGTGDKEGKGSKKGKNKKKKEKGAAGETEGTDALGGSAEEGSKKGGKKGKKDKMSKKKKDTTGGTQAGQSESTGSTDNDGEGKKKKKKKKKGKEETSSSEVEKKGKTKKGNKKKKEKEGGGEEGSKKGGKKGKKDKMSKKKQDTAGGTQAGQSESTGSTDNGGEGKKKEKKGKEETSSSEVEKKGKTKKGNKKKKEKEGGGEEGSKKGGKKGKKDKMSKKKQDTTGGTQAGQSESTGSTDNDGEGKKKKKKKKKGKEETSSSEMENKDKVNKKKRDKGKGDSKGVTKKKQKKSKKPIALKIKDPVISRKMLQQTVYATRSLLMGMTPTPSAQYKPVREPGKRKKYVKPFFSHFNRVYGTKVSVMAADEPRPACQFCLWVSDLPIRGKTLHEYVFRLVTHIRRTLRPLCHCRDGDVVFQVLTLCVHQWTGSLCVHILWEAFTLLKANGRIVSDLEVVINQLMHLGSNLWYAQAGYKDTRLPSIQDLKAKLVEQEQLPRAKRRPSFESNIFNTIIRHITESASGVQSRRGSFEADWGGKGKVKRTVNFSRARSAKPRKGRPPDADKPEGTDSSGGSEGEGPKKGKKQKKKKKGATGKAGGTDSSGSSEGKGSKKLKKNKKGKKQKKKKKGTSEEAGRTDSSGSSEGKGFREGKKQNKKKKEKGAGGTESSGSSELKGSKKKGGSKKDKKREESKTGTKKKKTKKKGKNTTKNASNSALLVSYSGLSSDRDKCNSSLIGPSDFSRQKETREFHQGHPLVCDSDIVRNLSDSVLGRSIRSAASIQASLETSCRQKILSWNSTSIFSSLTVLGDQFQHSFSENTAMGSFDTQPTVACTVGMHERPSKATAQEEYDHPQPPVGRRQFFQKSALEINICNSSVYSVQENEEQDRNMSAGKSKKKGGKKEKNTKEEEKGTTGEAGGTDSSGGSEGEGPKKGKEKKGKKEKKKKKGKGASGKASGTDSSGGSEGEGPKKGKEKKGKKEKKKKKGKGASGKASGTDSSGGSEGEGSKKGKKKKGKKEQKEEKKKKKAKGASGKASGTDSSGGSEGEGSKKGKKKKGKKEQKKKKKKGKGASGKTSETDSSSGSEVEGSKKIKKGGKGKKGEPPYSQLHATLENAFFWTSHRSREQSHFTKVRGLLNTEVITTLCETFKDCADTVSVKTKNSLGDGDCYSCDQRICQVYAVVFSQIGPHAVSLLAYYVPVILKVLKNPYARKIDWIKFEDEFEDSIRAEVYGYTRRRATYVKEAGIGFDSIGVKYIHRKDGAAVRIFPELIYGYDKVDIHGDTTNLPLLVDRHGDRLLINKNGGPILNERLEPLTAAGASLTQLPITKDDKRPYRFTPWMNDTFEMDWLLPEYPFSRSMISKIELDWNPWLTYYGWAQSDVDTGNLDLEMAVDIVTKVFIDKAEEEMKKEADTILSLKKTVAQITVLATTEVEREMEDGMHVALFMFTRATMLALLECMLPLDEMTIVTADTLRKGKKVVLLRRASGLKGKKKLQKMFWRNLKRKRDLNARFVAPSTCPISPWDLDLICAAIYKLSDRWFLDESTYEKSSCFLASGLTLANLMTWPRTLLERKTDNMPALVLDSLSHVLLVRHEMRAAIGIAAADVLMWAVPYAREAMYRVEDFLHDYQKPDYLVETLEVMAIQVMPGLSRRINKTATRIVQEMMFELAYWREHVYRQEDVSKELRRETEKKKDVKQLKAKTKSDMETVLNGIYEGRKCVDTIRRQWSIYHAEEILQYFRKTSTGQKNIVHHNLTTLKQLPCYDEWGNYRLSATDLLEVTWAVKAEDKKALPFVVTPVIEIVALFVTLFALAEFSVWGTFMSTHKLYRWSTVYVASFFNCILLAALSTALLRYDWGRPKDIRRRVELTKLKHRKRIRKQQANAYITRNTS